jgi:hypothetical protein
VTAVSLFLLLGFYIQSLADLNMYYANTALSLLPSSSKHLQPLPSAKKMHIFSLSRAFLPLLLFFFLCLVIMSSCHTFNSTRAAVGLATLPVVQSAISARPSSKLHSFTSRIPVLSQSSSHSYPSASIPKKSSIRSTPIAIPASASMPKKTEDSILKHVERVSLTPSPNLMRPLRWVIVAWWSVTALTLRPTAS